MRDRYERAIFPIGYMDVSVYTNIIDQLPAETEIDFHKDGEPLLHVHLPWMISYAKAKGMFTHVVTNGILLGKYKKEIVDSGLDLLTVSIIDEIPHGSINEFMDYKGSDKPLTQLKTYRDEDILPQSDKAIRRNLHNWTDDKSRKSGKRCSKLLNFAAVNWDGGYSICCVDYKRASVHFNVRDIPLKYCFEFSKMIYKWQEEGVFIPPCTTCNYWQD